MAIATFALKHIVIFGLSTLFASVAVLAAAFEDLIDSLEFGAISNLVAREQVQRRCMPFSWRPCETCLLLVSVKLPFSNLAANIESRVFR